MLIQRNRWDADADVVVVGNGSAGAAAAVSAAESGAQVLVIEKQDSPTPVNSSSLSTAVILSPSDVNATRKFMEAIQKTEEGVYWTEPDIIDVWARYVCENKKWLESLGGVLSVRRTKGEHVAAGYDLMTSYEVKGWGPAMLQLFYDRAKSQGVKVMAGLEATRLLENTRNEIIGVRAKRRDGKEINIQARRAVVLATGGFEYNEPMKLQYLPVYPTYFVACPISTGDGVRMAAEVGADLWHMNCCAAGLVLKFPEYPVAMTYGLEGHSRPSSAGSGLAYMTGGKKYAGWIIVDRNGKRFTNDNTAQGAKHGLYYELSGLDSRTRLRPRVPSYWVFDQQRMDAGPLVGGSSVRLNAEASNIMGIYNWSVDNKEELKRGWIDRADTARELGAKLGMGSLDETIRNFNTYCQHGEDPEFNREPDSLLPLSNPPYYAVKLWPGGPNTEGGPRRNRKCQVIGVNGEPIRGLYGAGELGSIFGMWYPAGGGNLAECIALGRVAGENAAGEVPR